MLSGVVVPSLTYFQLSLEFVRGVYWPHTFERLCGLDSGKDVRELKMRCIVWGMSRYLILILQMMQSSLQRLCASLRRALEVLNEESEPLGLRVSWVKTTIQAFNDILDAAILSVPVCGEDIEVR